MPGPIIDNMENLSLEERAMIAKTEEKLLKAVLPFALGALVLFIFGFVLWSVLSFFSPTSPQADKASQQTVETQLDE